MPIFMESSNASPIGFRLQLNNATNATSTNSAFFGTTTTNDLVLMTANTRRVTVSSAGRVGIGTGSPSAILDVSGSVSSTLYIAGSGVAYFLRSGLGLVSTIGPLSSIAVSIKASSAMLAGVGYYTTSDKRIKTNIELIDESVGDSILDVNQFSIVIKSKETMCRYK